MFKRLLDLYLAGKITEAGLDFWVEKGAITEKEKKEIIASKK